MVAKLDSVAETPVLRNVVAGKLEVARRVDDDDDRRADESSEAWHSQESAKAAASCVRSIPEKDCDFRPKGTVPVRRRHVLRHPLLNRTFCVS